jgi:hypothetical protein
MTDQDDEISKIMSEIEELQEDLAEVKVAPAIHSTSRPPLKAAEKEAEDTLSDFRGSADDASMEETLAGMKEEASTSSLLDEVETKVNSMTKTKKETTTSSEGSLSMTLTGNVRLNLRYEHEGQEVTVGFENQFLTVRLSDGTEFRIPVARGAVDQAA